MTPVAVVTGAAGGLGRACVERLGRDHIVLAADVASGSLHDLVTSLPAGRVHRQVCDLLDEHSVAALVKRSQTLGPLGAVVNAAGLAPGDAPPRALFEVNYVAAMSVLDAFVPHIGEGCTGVAVASIGAHRGPLAMFDSDWMLIPVEDAWHHFSERTQIEANEGLAYALAKRGVIVGCQARSRSWGLAGARLVTVSPGNLDTRMGRAARAAGAEYLISATGSGRAGQPDEIAALVAFLVSPEASYITGTDIRIDGGAVASLEFDPPTAEEAQRWQLRI